MSKNPITRATALTVAINVLKGAEDVYTAEDKANAVETLSKMLAQVSAPRKATVSKARIANEGLARKLAAMLPAEGINAKGITTLGVPEVGTTQKATAVMRVAVELGLVERVQDKKAITYKPVTD